MVSTKRSSENYLHSHGGHLVIPDVMMLMRSRVDTREFLDDSRARHMVIDNGTLFASPDFQEHCKVRRMKHIKFIPNSPQPNELAEDGTQESGRNNDQKLLKFLSCYQCSGSMKAIWEAIRSEHKICARIQGEHIVMLPPEYINHLKEHTNRGQL